MGLFVRIFPLVCVYRLAHALSCVMQVSAMLLRVFFFVWFSGFTPSTETLRFNFSSSSSSSPPSCCCCCCCCCYYYYYYYYYYCMSFVVNSSSSLSVNEQEPVLQVVVTDENP